MKKNVFITGATGGIGKSLVKSFIKNDYFVIMTGRKKSKVEELIDNFSKNVDFFECDLENPKKIDFMCQKIFEKYEKIDVLINNAGITSDNLFLRMDFNKWNSVLNVNLNANFLITKNVIKHMLRKKYGRIINITSVVCHTGNPGQSNYCASKAGIIGMSKSLAHEVAKRGITVNCISPGFIETDMTESLTEDQRINIIKNIPLAKYGKPEDISNCALFLASDVSSYITGQTIHVNGGMTMI
ncbi:MAG: 3-oxoacyl-[acyl-carrier-protein] reductase [Rickettsiales bacterium]|nr:3-oxoacyl-[acyl-carrier-protein] reductase [Rickettsiales bacterium]OUV53870.1 MAG: 3-oxoacyl-[acyl-carrier-protein] reductase [Rickettsiales bacterium TMED127]|tara:strand:- start:79223 stop:79948 length:726 start_codon:yes stop_codon:yes gene_type:complete